MRDFTNEKYLTKENFWDELYNSFPHSTEQFARWVDEYKKENNWRGLFNWSGRQLPKFHELPIGMQIGVIFQFFREKGYYDPEDISVLKLASVNDIIGFIEDTFLFNDNPAFE